MEREADKRLEELKNKGISIYSISRLNCIDQCPYQAYLNYIDGVPQEPNCWSCLGGKVHDALQACVDTGCDESIVKKAIQEELDNMDILGIEFPLDRNKQPSIRNNWLANMTRFAEEFKTPKGKFETEQLILYPINDHAYMQGYIDLIRHNKDGSIWILDWKTSSQFDKEHLISAGRQLILYGLAKQAEGFDIKRLSWVMLKYCITTWKMKNGKEKEKISEWRNLVKDLRGVLEKKLEDAGVDDVDADIMMQGALKQNSLDPFPDEVKSQFTTKIYVRDYEFSQENIDETLEYIRSRIAQYEQGGTDEKNYPPCDINKNSYFCAALCGYKNKCKYYQDYCTQFVKNDKESEDDDLF